MLAAIPPGKEAEILKQQNCEHSWALWQVAGEGRYCTKCGYRDYDFDD